MSKQNKGKKKSGSVKQRKTKLNKMLERMTAWGVKHNAIQTPIIVT